MDERLRQLGGSARLALDLVQFDPNHERAFIYALGDAVITDSRQEADKVFRWDKGERLLGRLALPAVQQEWSRWSAGPCAQSKQRTCSARAKFGWRDAALQPNTPQMAVSRQH